MKKNTVMVAIALAITGLVLLAEVAYVVFIPNHGPLQATPAAAAAPVQAQPGWQKPSPKLQGDDDDLRALQQEVIKEQAAIRHRRSQFVYRKSVMFKRPAMRNRLRTSLGAALDLHGSSRLLGDGHEHALLVQSDEHLDGLLHAVHVSAPTDRRWRNWLEWHQSPSFRPPEITALSSENSAWYKHSSAGGNE